MSLPLWAATCLVFVAAATARAASPQTTSPVLQEALGWLDAAEVPSAKGLQPVEVWTGSTSQGGDTDKERPVTIPAFLLSVHGSRFQVVTLWGMRQMSWLEGRADDPRQRCFASRSLEWAVKSQLDRTDSNEGIGCLVGPLPSELLRWVMLARHCRDLKDEALVQRIDTEIAQKLQERIEQAKDTRSPRQILEEDTAAYLLQLVLPYFQSSPWEDLRQKLERIPRILPGAPSAEKAKVLADRVAEWIEDERARPLLSHADILKLPTEQQAAEQVRRLRAPRTHWGMDPPEDTDVLGELVKLGHAAVPALLTTIDDLRPSRSVRYVTFKAWDHDGNVMTVGDLALHALNSISGKRFLKHGNVDVFLPTATAPSSVRQEAEAWWAAFQAKGEKQLLLDAIAAGGESALSPARQLLEKHPQEAGPVLVALHARLKTPREQRYLLDMLGQLKEPAVLALLKKELLGAATLECRVAAASSLRTLGQPGSTETMRKEWRQISDSIRMDTEGGRALIRHLATSQDLDAIIDLTQDLRRRSLGTRLEIMQQLRQAYAGTGLDSRVSTSPEVKAWIEKTLVGMLDDDEDVLTTGAGYRNPTVGDNAARWGLCNILPDEYAFEISASFKHRERARLRMAQQWHAKTGTPWTLPKVMQPLPDSRRNEIVSVHFADHGLQGTPVEKRLLAMRDKPLSPDELVAAMSDFGGALPEGVNGISVRLVRTDEPLGVRLKVWTRQGKPPENWQSFSYHCSVDLGGKQMQLSPQGSGPSSEMGDASRWAGFRKVLNEALAAPPDSELLVRLGLSAPYGGP